MRPFDRALSLKLDEATMLLEATSSPELKAILIARKTAIERHIFEAFSQKHSPAMRPDAETWEVIRTAILRRDGYKCKLCLSDDTTLQVHHLIPVEQGGETIPTNLLTLCSMCHETIHPWIEGKGYVAA